MISSFYAAVLALWIVGLSLWVIRLRRTKQIGLGDGGETELQRAIRAQGNAVEYIPIFLILLILAEMNQAPKFLIHAGGIVMFLGRLLHARGLLYNRLGDRVLGMQITLFTILGLAGLVVSWSVIQLR